MIDVVCLNEKMRKMLESVNFLDVVSIDSARNVMDFIND